MVISQIAFQSSLPRGERHNSIPEDRSCNEYFNPRSREGSDYSSARRSALLYLISILAPARGATPLSFHNPTSNKISILAPARGATCRRYSVCQCIGHFNPRSREGSDPEHHPASACLSHFNPRSREGSDADTLGRQRYYCQISILAPARGATDISVVGILHEVFQSSLPRGERRYSVSENL